MTGTLNVAEIPFDDIIESQVHQDSTTASTMASGDSDLSSKEQFANLSTMSAVVKGWSFI